MPQGKILIVDYESSIHRALHVSLAALGFEVEEAKTSEQALAMLVAGYYNLVLLDIDMPGVGGIETCREIRRLSPRSAVLKLTVRDGQEDKAKAFEVGAGDYVITKPCPFRDLVARIRAVLDSRQASPMPGADSPGSSNSQT